MSPSTVQIALGEYNATTGAPINPNFIATGLNGPYGLALSDNILFVSNFLGNTVSEYNATTGAPINASLITGLNEPTGLALSDNNLFVANFGVRLGNTTPRPEPRTPISPSSRG
jgi:DNA-binding beta-propeller fold protein YncE